MPHVSSVSPCMLAECNDVGIIRNIDDNSYSTVSMKNVQSSSWWPRERERE